LLFVVHFDALALKQNVQATIAKPPSLVGQLAQPFAQNDIISLLLLLLEDRPVQLCQFARPTLAEAVPIHDIGNSSALHIRR
jgi:hypothetical protein